MVVLLFDQFPSLPVNIHSFCFLAKHRSVRGWRSAGPGYERFYLEKSSDASRTSRERSRNSPKNLSLENIEIHNRGARSSFGQDSVRDESDLPGVLMFGSVDISGQNLDFSIAASSPKEQSTKHSAVSADWY